LGVVVGRHVFALLCHLSVVVGLVLVGGLVFENVASGMAAASVLPSATRYIRPRPIRLRVGLGGGIMLGHRRSWSGSVVRDRRPILAGLFLGLVTGTAVFLIVVLPRG
jgi:hypothetical protein